MRTDLTHRVTTQGTEAARLCSVAVTGAVDAVHGAVSTIRGDLRAFGRSGQSDASRAFAALGEAPIASAAMLTPFGPRRFAAFQGLNRATGREPGTTV